MIRFASPIFALALLAYPLSQGAQADDTVFLKGQPGFGSVSTLKGPTVDDAAVTQVFHGRLLGCWCCRRPICCDPAPVCCECPCGVGGYSVAPPMSYGFAPPSFAPAQEFARSNPNPYYYAPAPNFAPAPSGAVVTLPRLGLSFTIGGANGLLANRSTLGNRLSGDMTPADEHRALPPADARPDQFRYDGGPASPIPMPGVRTQPLPLEPAASPALNNRVKASPSKPTWVAYGEQPKQLPASAPRNVFVREGSR